MLFLFNKTTIETSLQTLGHDELNEDRELSEEVMEIYDDRAFIDQVLIYYYLLQEVMFWGGLFVYLFDYGNPTFG